MSKEENRPASKELHPGVYMLIIGLTLWLVLSVWSFATDGYTDYLLVVVSGFVFIAVALPCILWCVGRENGDAVRRNEESFRDWASADFDTSQGRLPGVNAAVEIVLPIAAVAFGMTAFGIVFHFAAHGAV
jgi:hypothetical protein